MEHNLTIKTYMAIMAERDSAIREKNMALDERRRAFAERDMAMLQRDAALAERNSALEERDKALSALQFQETPTNETDHVSPDSPSNGVMRGSKQHLYHHQQMHLTPLLDETEYNNQREIPPNNPYHSAGGSSESAKPRKAKQAKETTARGTSTKNPSKSQGKGKGQIEDSSCWKMEPDLGTDDGDEELDEDLEAWKESLGLNQINFDETSMPAPVCSCTGLPQPCYKWANGGWQSACCTTTMSMYPLPQMSNKRHARVGGRKMSGNVFTKLLNRLAAEGQDLSIPIDLKDHWSKHGTNRYCALK